MFFSIHLTKLQTHTNLSLLLDILSGALRNLCVQVFIFLLKCPSGPHCLDIDIEWSHTVGYVGVHIHCFSVEETTNNYAASEL